MSIHPDNAGGRGKRYSPQFRTEALALIASGRTLKQVARDLGVSSWTLIQWRKAAAGPSAQAPAIPGDTTSAAELAAENARLRKALAKSELHADILKKALAIVGQHPPDSSN